MKIKITNKQPKAISISIFFLAALVLLFGFIASSSYGEFTDSSQSLGSSESLGVELGDVDGDGDLDAFVANDGQNEVWLNDGNGNFTESSQSLGS